MVEKDRPLSQNSGLKRPQNDLLEEAGQSLSNFRPKDERSTVAISESPAGLNSGNEVDKFNTLCDGVLTAHSLFDLYLTEMLTIKDELLKHSLPSNLLINFTLTCSKLYRSASDLSTPTNELVRLVRLYSVQWETKSNILKKIHDDYESKQRRLDIALKKLELIGVASERMEKENRIRNWEKVYSKVMSAKSHGHRWKFLIGSLKEKVKTGDILSIPYPSSSAKDEVVDCKAEPIIPRRHRKNVKNLRHQTLLRRDSRDSRRSYDDQNEESREESEIFSDEDPLTMSRMRKITPNHETKPSFIASRFKSKYPFEPEAGPSELSRRLRSERVESPTGIRNANSPRTQNRRYLKQKNVSFFDEAPEVNKPRAKEDKNVGTGEIEYDRFLHVRIFKPECKLVSEPRCTICVGEQVFNSEVYSDSDDENVGSTPEVNKSPQNSEKHKYQEFMFSLPADKVYLRGQGITSIESLQLRIAIQGENGGQIVAMSTVGYDELEMKESVVDAGKETPKKHAMLSLVSDKETMFNSVVGHVPVICYQTKKERLRLVDQSAQTLTFQELIDEALADKKKAEDEDGIEEDNEAQKIYSEADFKEIKYRHVEELECLRNEYELQLHEIARISLRRSPDGISTASAEPKYLSACTSPIPQRPLSPAAPCPRKNSSRPRTAESKSTPAKRTKKIKTGQVLPEWGKNLPENFFDRLEQFSQASAKYHQNLNEKTKKAIQESYELQMATQNRLSVEEDEMDLNDVCLPALFMPSRMRTVYSPKASLYFHPSGVTRGRFTQAPSVFKLPSSVERNCSSVMNLFEMSQNFLTSGPTWLSQEVQPQSCRTTGTRKENISSSSLLNEQRKEDGMKIKSE